MNPGEIPEIPAGSRNGAGCGFEKSGVTGAVSGWRAAARGRYTPALPV